MYTLLKLDSKDKIRILKLYADGDTLKREGGVLGGNLVPTSKVCKPKNVGRSNETTAEEQVISELKSERNKKIDEGYIEAPHDYADLPEEILREAIETYRIKIPSPMLAKPYDAKYADFEDGVYVSNKLDGMRCLAEVTETSVTLWSRGAKKIDTMDHIIKQLEELRSKKGFTGILDGELYVHDPSDNFQDIMKAIKKYRAGVSETIEYHVYDVLSDATADVRFLEYMNLLKGEEGNIKPVRQLYTKDPEEMMSFHAAFLSRGFEGSMVKNKLSSYKNSRSSDLLKLKDFMDEEFSIIDVVPMDNYPEQGKLLMVTAEGKQFTSTPKASHKEREEILLNKEEYIGAMGTVTFFGRTDDGIPRFPIFKGVRLQEDLS